MQPDADAILPDGTTFPFWQPAETRGRVLVVDPAHQATDDDNDATADAPLRTISRAAELAGPGDTVLIHPGVYRECVRPARGGTGPDAMIHYRSAEPGKAILTGGEIIDGNWQPSRSWRRPAQAAADVWQARLPRAWFPGDNPLARPNRAIHSAVGGFIQEKSGNFPAYVRSCGLLFQDGRRMEQVNGFTQLFDAPGRWWPDPSGVIVHVRPFDDVAPTGAQFEITARSQCFAPDDEELSWIRLSGLVFRCCGNVFPFMPQQGAISSNRGHHWVIEDCLVEQVNAIGVDLGRRDARMEFPATWSGHILRRNVVRECGICGLAALGMAEGLIEDNLVEDCCWHDVEEMWESAGIKFHHNHNTLLRRNVVRRLPHGCGIWLDFDNRNSRCTRNVVTQVTSLFGGIFVEASHVPNRVDHNVVIDMHPVQAGGGNVATGGGHGVYAHDTDFLRVDHNLFARCAGSGVHLPKGQADRMVQGRGSCSRRHEVERNVLVDCGRWVSFQDADNHCDANAYAGAHQPGPFRLLGPDEWLDLEAWGEFHGFEPNGGAADIRIQWDPDTLRLALQLHGEPPAPLGIFEVEPDWFGRPRPEEGSLPGPFAADSLATGEMTLLTPPQVE